MTKLHLRVYVLGLLLGIMFVAWVFLLLVRWFVVGGECIHYGHTLGITLALTIVRIFMGIIFSKDNQENMGE